MRRALPALLLVACAGRPPDDARAARDRLASALVSGDAVSMGALSRSEPEQLTPSMEEASAELRARGEAIASAPMDESARIYLRSGGVVVLVREDDGWRVDRGLLGAPALASPTDALAAFARALERVRAARVTAVLSRGTRILFADELERWQRGLADVNAIPVVIEADRATATLPTGVTIELVREAGEWRVEDVSE